MKYINNAFNSIDDRRYRNWDGYSLVYTYDFIKSLEPHLDMNDINVIFDIGSRDGCQSMELSDWFPEATIYLFEPVEHNFNYCKDIQVVNRGNIKPFKLALSDTNGVVDFYEVINGNVGASSLLKTKNENSHILNYGKQVKTTVESICGDIFMKNNMIESVDLIWMDVQGAELLVLNGFTDNINNVKAIYTEVAVNSEYSNGTNKDELLDFMSRLNFKPIKYIGEPNQFTELDIIFMNKKYIK